MLPTWKIMSYYMLSTRLFIFRNIWSWGWRAGGGDKGPIILNVVLSIQSFSFSFFYTDVYESSTMYCLLEKQHLLSFNRDGVVQHIRPTHRLFIE